MTFVCGCAAVLAMQRVLVTHAQVGGSGGATVLGGTCDVSDVHENAILILSPYSIIVVFMKGWGVCNFQGKCYVTNIICLGIMQG